MEVRDFPAAKTDEDELGTSTAPDRRLFLLVALGVGVLLLLAVLLGRLSGRRA